MILLSLFPYFPFWIVKVFERGLIIVGPSFLYILVAQMFWQIAFIKKKHDIHFCVRLLLPIANIQIQYSVTLLTISYLHTHTLTYSRNRKLTTHTTIVETTDNEGKIFYNQTKQKVKYLMVVCLNKTKIINSFS